jgi:hypothetical protein
MSAVVTLVINKRFVDISDAILPSHWPEILGYLVLFDLYSFAGED